MSSTDNPLHGFGVAVHFVKDQAVVVVHGDLDLATAPELGTIVDSVINRGHSDLVLDLSALEFMSVAGLTVIAGAADRLGQSGQWLTIRAASNAARRVLDICGLPNAVRMEDASTVRYEGLPRHLGSEQTVMVPGVPVVQPEEVTHIVRRLASIQADDEVVDGVLRLVVALARATVGGADGVSVSLSRRGSLVTVAASDQTISAMDADQYATGEGPCVDAAVMGRWFYSESLDREVRWPAFTPRARELGINAILSSPLLARDRPIGSLNIYSRTVGAFTTSQQELASIFASEVSVILADAGADVSQEAFAQRLAEALSLREVIAQAQGALMQREGLSADDAYRQLLRNSAATNSPLGQGAAEVVASTQPRAGPDQILSR